MNWVLNQAFKSSNLHQHTIIRLYFNDLACTFSNEAQRNDVFQHTVKAIHSNKIHKKTKTSKPSELLGGFVD